MQNSQNVVEFEIPEIGSFKAYKEPPVAAFFFDRRTELAKLLGGRTELNKLESTVRLWRNSNDPLEKEIAFSASLEIIRADGILTMRECITDVPKGFSLSTMSSDQFDLLYAALEKARHPFRPGDGAETTPTS
jgi:hypothetical protein